MERTLVLVIALSFAVAASACSKNTPGSDAPADPSVHDVPATPEQPTQPQEPEAAAVDAAPTEAPVECGGSHEFERAYFNYRGDQLSADAQSSLDENVDRLARCPDLCIELTGWVDDTEPDPAALSGERANTVGVYYFNNLPALDAEHFGIIPGGVHPDSRSDEDPTAGDSRVRYVETRVLRCQ